MRLTFWGAARQVTGSMYLLELEDDYTILIDCGSDMDRWKRRIAEEDESFVPLENELEHGIFPFEPTQISAVILTHAHIDHTGALPNLIREGYEGPIYCTAATLSLTRLLLLDAAALNARKLKKANDDKGAGKGKKKAKGGFALRKDNKLNAAELYLEKHVSETMDQFSAVEFGQRYRLKQGVEMSFSPCGHLLGAASVILDVTENGVSKRIGFSGDIGRKNYPLLADPQPLGPVDYLLCETTYGNRRHRTLESPEEALAKVIKETCIDQPGKLIIPAFSVGRTQALLYTLNRLYEKRAFPPIRVFADSPLAYQSTRVYENFTSLLNPEAQQFKHDHEGLFDFENLVYVKDMKQSQAIQNYSGPHIIISSSGMVSGGRVEEHIYRNISNPSCTILMIGYASEGTLGYELMHGKSTLTLKNGREMAVLARVESIDAFSGHGDQADLTQFVQYQDKDRLKKVFLVHGEYESMQDFRTHLNGLGYNNVEIPARGDSFEL